MKILLGLNTEHDRQMSVYVPLCSAADPIAEKMLLDRNCLSTHTLRDAVVRRTRA
jgi:hypothetical protein